jgi:hypothetical protein
LKIQAEVTLADVTASTRSMKTREISRHPTGQLARVLHMKKQPLAAKHERVCPVLRIINP